MAFTRGNAHSDTAKKEQIITEFFPKTAHIILESRAPYVSSRNSSVDSPSSSSSSSPSHRPRDKWFNLPLKEGWAALENIDFWRQSNLDPMIIDVILVQTANNRLPVKADGIRDQGLKEQEFQNETNTEKVIERWVVQYQIKKSKDGSSRSKRPRGNLHLLYKNSIMLLRSLYATVRLLPAYKLFRELISSGHIRNYTLAHRVNSFVEPFTREEEADMRRFCFTPVDTLPGRLCLSVLYHDALFSDLNFEPLIPVAVSPKFIPDYVGSPKVDPIKRFPSPPVSQNLPSYDSLPSQHSWSSDVHHGSPPSILPSPTNSDLKASVSKLKPCALVLSNAHLLPPKPREKTGAKGSVGEKFSLKRDESGKHAGLISSNSSPRVSIFGSSNRLSLQGDFDDAEFACHFAVDQDEMLDSGSRSGSFDPRKQPSDPFEAGGSARVWKSQDAAVGALVLMLKRAPPLQHDCTNSTSLASRPGKQATTYSNTASSGLMFTKTKADVLSELSTYREMKEQFLRQGDLVQADVLLRKSHLLS